MDDQGTNREGVGGVTNPFRLMGPTTCTRYVKLLMEFDRMAADWKAKHTLAVESHDDEAAGRYARVIDYINQDRRFVEEELRRITQGEK